MSSRWTTGNARPVTGQTLYGVDNGTNSQLHRRRRTRARDHRPTRDDAHATPTPRPARDASTTGTGTATSSSAPPRRRRPGRRRGGIQRRPSRSASLRRPSRSRTAGREHSSTAATRSCSPSTSRRPLGDVDPKVCVVTAQDTIILGDTTGATCAHRRRVHRSAKLTGATISARRSTFSDASHGDLGVDGDDHARPARRHGEPRARTGSWDLHPVGEHPVGGTHDTRRRSAPALPPTHDALLGRRRDARPKSRRGPTGR